MNLKIVTPEGILFEDTIDSITLPTKTGEITVLKNHIPLVSEVVPGEIITKKDGKESYMSVSTGVLQVNTDEVTILADTAEEVESLVEEKILAAKEEAEKILQEKRDVRDVEYAAAAAILERELARLKVVKRRKK